MNNILKKITAVLIFFLLFPVIFSSAQTSTLSPYSRFGLGDLLFSGYTSERGMGGASIASFNPTRLNFNNPASYSYDTLMVLDFGVDGEFARREQGENSSKQTTGSISNFSIGFPLVRGKWGMAFGFIPYSGTGYDTIFKKERLDSTNTMSTKFTGNGGYTRFYVGTGLKITKNLSAGITGSYLYGTVERTRRVEFTNNFFFNNRYKEELTLADIYLEFGMHYNGKINEKYNYAIGLTGSPAQKMNAKRDVLWENYLTSAFGFENVRDTVSYLPEQSGEVIIPAKAGLGIQVSDGTKWLWALDFNWQDWSNYKSYGKSDSLKSSYKISAGAQFIPDLTGLKYYQRMQYRGGLYFNRTFLELRNNAINDMGISLGVGLPFRKSYGSMLNFAVELGQRGTLSDNLVQERYVRLAFGITLNEDWFRKRKFD